MPRTIEPWKINLISVWFGCFFTGLAISQIIPFLPLYLEQLGVTGGESLSLWSGLTFSITFVVSAAVAPLWGSLADRKGRKLMLLRAASGMGVVILLQAFVTEAWQLLLLRALMGLTSGYIPNAMALVAAQVPRERSGWGDSATASARSVSCWRRWSSRCCCLLRCPFSPARPSWGYCVFCWASPMAR